MSATKPPPATIPTLNELARALIADGWPVISAFREAIDRLEYLKREANAAPVEKLL